ncbi:helicase Ski2, partial [Clostridium perfringens]
ADVDMLQCLNRRLGKPSGEQDGAYERVGLMNIVQRLRLTFGPEASLTLANLPQGGMSVSLYLPQSHHHGFLPEGEEE